jgi:hypothetical protein
MKQVHFVSLVVLGLLALPLDARADLEVLGVYGIPAAPSEASCWGTSVGGNTFGIRINNNCPADPNSKGIYYPLVYQSTWASTWHAQIRASSGVSCGVFAEPDDGGVYPVGSGYGWSSGTWAPIDVAVWTYYTAAYVYCLVPPGGYVVSVRWWLS